MTSAASVATSEKQHDFSTHKTACAFSCSSEDQLIAQLEYYFSQDNIITDHYLRSQMDDENYVPIMTISTLPRSNSTLRTSKTRSSSLPPWSRTRVTFYRSTTMDSKYAPNPAQSNIGSLFATFPPVMHGMTCSRCSPTVRSKC